MQTLLTNSYDKELKEQVAKECIETNNYAAVSSKHDKPVTTITDGSKVIRTSRKKRAGAY